MPTLANIQGASLSEDPTAVGRGIMQGAQLGNLIRQNRLQDEALLAEQNRQGRIDEMIPLAFKGNEEAYLNLAKDAPEVANALGQIAERGDRKAAAKAGLLVEQSANVATSALSSGDPRVMRQIYLTDAATHQQNGDVSSAEDSLRMAELAINDIDAFTAEAQQDQFQSKNVKTLLEVSGLGGDPGSNVGTVSPKDFTVDSMKKYEETGDIGVLERYRPKTVKIGNIEHAYNTESQKYEPVVDYSGEGLSDQEAAAAENEAARASRIEFGKQKDSWDNNQPKYLNNISAAEQKQTVVRNTADKIKELASGWNTKYGSSLSAIPGSEARVLKGLIDTMKANSAFSTLTDLKASGGTLGAISEAELNLLERAWGALDQGGDNAEFLRVLDQLVDQNAGSVSRARNAFDMNKKRFSGSYDDAQRQRQDENTVSWDAL